LNAITLGLLDAIDLTVSMSFIVQLYIVVEKISDKILLTLMGLFEKIIQSMITIIGFYT